MSSPVSPFHQVFGLWHAKIHLLFTLTTSGKHIKAILNDAAYIEWSSSTARTAKTGKHAWRSNSAAHGANSTISKTCIVDEFGKRWRRTVKSTVKRPVKREARKRTREAHSTEISSLQGGRWLRDAEPACHKSSEHHSRFHEATLRASSPVLRRFQPSENRPPSTFCFWDGRQRVKIQAEPVAEILDKSEAQGPHNIW